MVEALRSINDRLGQICAENHAMVAGVDLPELGTKWISDTIRMARKEDEKLAEMLAPSDEIEYLDELPMIGGNA